MKKNEIDKRVFKLSGNIAMISNLNFGLFICVLISFGLMIWRFDITSIILLLGFILLFFITSFLNIRVKKKLTKFKFTGLAKELFEKSIKESKLIIIPFIEVITTTRLRSSLWGTYVDQKTAKIKNESELWSLRLELLEELKSDGFISQIRYDKLKLIYEENFNKISKIEKKKKVE